MNSRDRDGCSWRYVATGDGLRSSGVTSGLTALMACKPLKSRTSDGLPV
ncbi:hypothetical protein SAMN05216525_13316 [Bradyrhizobium sp. Gha]|nr:hypothetical protein SAMN05216525_13316 [Bradyrhizobium sp. Gha]